MKLDKIKFARLVGMITHIAGRTMDEDEIDVINHAVDFDVPVPQLDQPIRANAAEIDRLLYLMYQGEQKIEAIKQYRTITGHGLKEAKDAVEKHWGLYASPDAKLLSRIRQALGTNADGDDLVQVAESYKYLADQHTVDDSEPATFGDILRTVSKD